MTALSGATVPRRSLELLAGPRRIDADGVWVDVGEISLARHVIAETKAEFLGGPVPAGDAAWTFEFGAHLTSAWGTTTYGGALGAACVAVARELAPRRQPRSLHVQFLCQVPNGQVASRGRVVVAGRTVTTAEVEILDADARPAVLALITLVDTQPLARDRDHTASPRIELVTEPLDRPVWRSPVADFLGVSVEHYLTSNDLPRMVTGEASYATRTLAPWRNVTDSGPELACLIADMCNGGAISQGMRDVSPDRYAFPNTDLSLRFSGLAGQRETDATGTLLCVFDGTTIAGIAVHSRAGQLAHGLSTSVLVDRSA